MTDRPSDSLSGQDLWDVLGRYVAGELQPREVEQVREWMAQDPARSQMVDTLARVTSSLKAARPAGLDVEGALKTVQLQKNQPKTFRLRDARAWTRDWSGTLIKAAAILVLAGGGTAIWQAFAGGMAPEIAYTTLVGHTNTIKLSDGSRVILGPSSRLTVRAGYLASGRELDLTGEAYFDVRHNPAMPFRVHVGNAEVEDVGTTFNVRSEGDGEVQVVVASGSVAMQDTTARRQSVVLKAGDRAVLSRGHNIAAEHGADTAAALAWTQGRVRFDNASVSHVRTELRRWYGIELDVSDTALANRHVTASFGAEPVGQVVHIIALTLGASVDQHGDTMVLKALPGGAPRR